MRISHRAKYTKVFLEYHNYVILTIDKYHRRHEEGETCNERVDCTETQEV